MNINIKELRGASWTSRFIYRSLCDSLCKLPSPYFSFFFISRGIKPNTITLIMVLFGILGGVLFSLPFIESKILAVVVYWLWYIFDCSDGEVARYTKTFSKYGKELDWVSHLSCHSLFYFSLYISFCQSGGHDMKFLSLISLLFVSLELISRNLIAFDAYLFEDQRFSETRERNKYFRFILLQLFNFPTFVLFFPIVYIFDLYLNYGFAIFVYLIWGSCLSLYSLKEFIRYVAFFYKN